LVGGGGTAGGGGAAAVGVDGEDTRVPVTVLTGWLGAGKTTLLNYILTQQHGKKIAVIENEYGEVGIDDALVQQKFDAEEEIFEMNNGCICCTVRGDLLRIMTKILKRKKKLDAVLIETTGLADPAPVAQTFFMDATLKEKCRLDAIVTLVDAKHILLHLDDDPADGADNQAVAQVAFADKILLNKIDLVTPDELRNVTGRLREINANCDVIKCQNAVVPLDRVLGLCAFDLDKILEQDSTFLTPELEDGHADSNDQGDGHGHGHAHGHTDDCKDDCHDEHGEDGANAVEGGASAAGASGIKKRKHTHSSAVGSHSIILKGSLDLKKLNEFISVLLRDKGPDLYRFKGVLSVKGMDAKFVFQGVHMVFTGEPATAWGADEERQNRMVFIGKNLDKAFLQKSFEDCIVTE